MSLNETLTINTDRLIIRLPKYSDIDAIIDFYIDNKDYLEPFEPIKPENFYTEDYWIVNIDLILKDFEENKSLRLFIFDDLKPMNIIGMVSISNIITGAFNACNIGYNLAESKQGNGYMTEALNGVIDYVFTELKLHRIMANYMPHNIKSGKLLKELGFTVEGFARNYLLINGVWEDHILTSISNSLCIEDKY